MAFSRAAMMLLFPLLLGMGILPKGTSKNTTTANTTASQTGTSTASITESGVIVPAVFVPLFLIAVTVALIVVFVCRRKALQKERHSAQILKSDHGLCLQNGRNQSRGSRSKERLNGTIARLCKGHSKETTNDIAEINANCAPVYENVRKENACRSNFDNPAFVGDQNPRLTQSSDIDNSSYVNVPAMAANPTHSHNQMMPTYESTEHGRNPGSRNLDTHREKAPAPRGEDYPPYEEMEDTGARMPGVGTAASSGEETESPYAGLDQVERSEYLDLRRLGFAHQSPAK